tara:strand:- start:37 stop:486 length:450 start_codon:yes stop_codon:yes gene_type:complete
MSEIARSNLNNIVIVYLFAFFILFFFAPILIRKFNPLIVLMEIHHDHLAKILKTLNNYTLSHSPSQSAGFCSLAREYEAELISEDFIHERFKAEFAQVERRSGRYGSNQAIASVRRLPKIDYDNTLLSPTKYGRLGSYQSEKQGEQRAK